MLQDTPSFSAKPIKEEIPPKIARPKIIRKKKPAKKLPACVTDKKYRVITIIRFFVLLALEGR